MSGSVNKVMLLGYLGCDPDVKFFTDGQAFVNIRLATNQIVKDKQTGEGQQRTEWHTVYFTRRLAEVIGQYCHKGSLVYIEGSLRTRTWEDETGTKHWATDIKGWQLLMLPDGQFKQTETNVGDIVDDLPF